MLCVIRSDKDSNFKSKKSVKYRDMPGYVCRYSTAVSGHCQYAEAAMNTLRAISRCMLNEKHLVRRKF